MDQPAPKQTPYFDLDLAPARGLRARARPCGADLGASPRTRRAHAEARHDARATAKRELEEDGDGRKCAEDLSAFQDALIALAYDFTTTHIYPPRIPRRRNAWRSWRKAATAAACSPPAPISISCSCSPTSRPPGARASPNTCSICCGTWASRSATPRAISTNASAAAAPT